VIREAMRHKSMVALGRLGPDQARTRDRAGAIWQGPSRHDPSLTL